MTWGNITLKRDFVRLLNQYVPIIHTVAVRIRDVFSICLKSFASPLSWWASTVLVPGVSYGAACYPSFRSCHSWPIPFSNHLATSTQDPERRSHTRWKSWIWGYFYWELDLNKNVNNHFCNSAYLCKDFLPFYQLRTLLKVCLCPLLPPLVCKRIFSLALNFNGSR